MALTPQQLAALKAHIEADPALAAQPNNSDGAFAIAAALNQPAAPTFVVWKSSLALETITSNRFEWVEVDSLSVGKARIWEWMFGNPARSINPSKDNVRAGIMEVWKGTAAKLAVQAAVLAHCKRAASRAEKLFATGTGSDAAPAVMGFEGDVSYQDVREARELP